MKFLVLDTCILLNIVSDARLHPLTRHLFFLIDNGKATLCIPEPVVEEFARHKDEIYKEEKSRIKGAINSIKQAKIAMNESQGKLFHATMEMISEKLVEGEPKATETITLFETVISGKKSKVLPLTDSMKLRAAERGMKRMAPFRGSKNSLNDALIIECYHDFVKQMAPGDSAVFVTTNTHDFSKTDGDQRLPHDDLAHMFDGKTSRYFIDIRAALDDIEPLDIEKEEERIVDHRIAQLVCQHEYDDKVGTWLNSRYGGGLSWHLRCKKCGMLFDTGEFYD